MPPKRKNDDTTPSVFDAWKKRAAVKKQPKLNGSVFKPNEVIDISESQEEEDGPSPSTTVIPSLVTKSTVDPVMKWASGVNKPMGRMSSSARRSMVLQVSDTDLRKMGCDVDELKVIEASANVECIQEDVEIVRKLISSNCALIFPKRAIFILSMFIRNWLRIFPTYRICICSSEQEWIDALKVECSLMGIDGCSFSQLQKSEIPITRQLMFMSSKILYTVTSSDHLASEIRCVIFHLSGPETPKKLKQTVNEMLMKKISCRFILIGGGGSFGGKTGAIARRQGMVTTLHLSQWIEPNEDPFATVIKPRLQYPIRVRTWNDTNLNTHLPRCGSEIRESDGHSLVEAIDLLEEVVKEVIDGSGVGNGVEEMNPRDIIYAPLNLLSNKSTGVEECVHVLSLLYHLFSFGKQAFEKRLAVVASESSHLEMKLLTSLPFTRLLTTLNQLEEDDHPKIKLIKDIIHKAVNARKGGVIKGVILVDTPSIVQSLADSLSLLCGLIKVDIYPLGSPQFPLSRARLILQSGGIAIMSVDSQDAIHAFQSLAASHIHLVISTSRRSAINVENMSMIGEWHLILHELREPIREMAEEEGRAFTHQTIEAASSLNSYPFNFERSVLSLDVSSAVIRISAERGKVHRCNGVSLTPTGRALLASRNITWMQSRLPRTLSQSSLLWNESLHCATPSSLSHRLVSFISPFSPPALPRSLPSRPLSCCTPSNGEVFYSSLISKLSHLFT